MRIIRQKNRIEFEEDEIQAFKKLLEKKDEKDLEEIGLNESEIKILGNIFDELDGVI